VLKQRISLGSPMQDQLPLQSIKNTTKALACQLQRDSRLKIIMSTIKIILEELWQTHLPQLILKT